MTEQIHRRLVDEQVKMVLEGYLKKEISAEQGMDLLRRSPYDSSESIGLGLKRRQFFKWVKKFKEDHDGFTIEYSRKWSNRRIDKLKDLSFQL